jgi:hypothetical protein
MADKVKFVVITPVHNLRRFLRGCSLFEAVTQAAILDSIRLSSETLV